MCASDRFDPVAADCLVLGARPKEGGPKFASGM